MRVPTWLLCVLCVLPAFAAARPPEVDLRNVAGPWTQVHLDANGIGFHTLLSGPPTARRVVFLHGFPDLAVTWRRTWELLGHDDFRMVAPDLRGYGGTDAPKGGYDIDTLSEDVLELAAASARADGADPAAPFLLVGHDWGAAIAWVVAARHPERLAGLVVANVPHPEVFAEALRTDPDQRKRSAYMKRLATPGAAAVMAGLSRKAWGKLYRENLSQPTMLTEADLDLRRAAFGKAARCRGPLRYYRELLDLEKKKGRAPEPDVTVPTVILWGARDKYLKYGLGILSALHVKAESTVVTLPHAGHWMPWESPETFAKAVRDLWTHVVVSVIP